MYIGCDTADSFRALKKEFGLELKQFLIGMGAESPQAAAELLKLAEV